MLAISTSMYYNTLVISRCDEMVDVADSKSAASDGVPVRVRSPAPEYLPLFDTMVSARAGIFIPILTPYYRSHKIVPIICGISLPAFTICRIIRVTTTFSCGVLQGLRFLETVISNEQLKRKNRQVEFPLPARKLL